jgi:hypothetical protein
MHHDVYLYHQPESGMRYILYIGEFQITLLVINYMKTMYSIRYLYKYKVWYHSHDLTIHNEVLCRLVVVRFDLQRFERNILHVPGTKSSTRLCFVSNRH